MPDMDSHHILRHSKQQATQGLALAGVIITLFGIYVAFAFAAPYYEKSVMMLSQLPQKQQAISAAAKALTPPARRPGALVPGQVVGAKTQIEVQQYNLNGQITVLVFSFAMYKIAFLLACSLIFVGSCIIWSSYHGWWNFTKRQTSSGTDRAAIKAPSAVVRRKAARA